MISLPPSAIVRLFMLTAKRKARLKEVARARQANFALVLEDIHDPHNAAAILRTADAFGVQDVYFIFEKVPSYNPRKVGKASSSSANKWLTFYTFKSSVECLSQLKKKKYILVSTILDKKAKNLLTTNFDMPKIALIVGNEHLGVSDTVKKMADLPVYIPMRGMVQSLNVSVTAALMLFEITRQRIADASPALKRSSAEITKLYKEFEKRA